MIDSYLGFFLMNQFNPEDESDAGRLQKLFDVSRVIMKAKNESCEEIMEEYEKEVKSSKKKGWSRSLRKKRIVFTLKILGIIHYNQHN